MKFIDVIDKEKCTGCMACKNACPKNIIEIEENDEGFLYPQINNDYCINCNICRKVCPVETPLKENKNEIVVYACKNIDDKVRIESSSGGIFSLIANYILEQNGVVFGAAFNEKFEVVHDWVDKKEELEKFRGSKYLQSKIGNSYKLVKEFLEEGKKVLFTGTPCQVEGLLSYLRKDYENLYTQDFICHGVPSPKVWKKHLEYKLKKNKEMPEEINFRKKDIFGWKNFRLNFKYKNFEENKDRNEDFYMRMFLENYDLRKTCYNCNFKKEKRLSDVTVADFWGITDVNLEMYDEKGVSALLINSEKGEKIFESIKKDLIFSIESIEDIKKYNYPLIKSVPYNEKREDFFKDLNEKAFEEIMKKY